MRQQSRVSGNGRGRWLALASAADQGLASLGNVLLVVVIARASDVQAFADFMVAYVVYSIILGVVSSFVGQPLILVGDEDTEVLDQAIARALGMALGGSLLVGAALATVGVLTSATPLAALGAVLVVLLGQEACRFAFAARRRPDLALATDSVKLVLVVATLAIVRTPDPGTAILLWGLAVVPACLLSMLMLRVRPDVRSSAQLFRRGYLGRRFVIEFLVGNGSSQVTVLALGSVGSPTVVSALRGATTLLGPVNTLFNAVTSFAPPFLLRRRPRERVRRAAWLGGLLAVVSAAWAGVLILLPPSVGQQLLGASWDLAATVLPAAAVQYVAAALSTAALVALRTTAPRTTLPLQVTFSLVSVATTVIGFALEGLSGAAWGLAAGSALKCAALWWRVRTLR